MKSIFLPFWMVEELETYFLKTREDFINNPTDEKLDNLEFIQEERRIQDPSKRLVIHRNGGSQGAE